MNLNKFSLKGWPLIIMILVLAVAILVIFGARARVLNYYILGDSPAPKAAKVWTDDAEQRIENSRNTFEINGSKIKMEAERLATSAILKNSANSEQELEEIVNACSCPVGCITNTLGAVQVFYAVNLAGDFKLYYKPALFCRIDSSYGQGGHYYGRYSKCSSQNNYYEYDNNSKSFKAVTGSSVAVANNDITRYTTSVAIDRPDSCPIPDGPFYPVQYCDNIRGDAKSVIFPIDELILLCKSDPEICLWNAVEPLSLMEVVSGTRKEQNYVKHSLILSTGDVHKNIFGGLSYSSNSSFSDLSHLCPPSCNGNDFTFALREKRINPFQTNCD
jgi:hypothetical protein